MIEQHFVPFESGLPAEMEQLDFDETCLGIYNRTIFPALNGKTIPAGTLILLGTAEKGKINPDFIQAPLWSQAQSWLREKHQMNLETHQADSGNYVFSLTTTGDNNSRIWQDGNWPYFEALTKGLDKAIEIIKRRQKINLAV